MFASRLEHLIVKSYIGVNCMYAYDTEIRVSGIKVTWQYKAIQGMSFLVRMLHEIILHHNIASVFSVTLY